MTYRPPAARVVSERAIRCPFSSETTSVPAGKRTSESCLPAAGAPSATRTSIMSSVPVTSASVWTSLPLISFAATRAPARSGNSTASTKRVYDSRALRSIRATVRISGASSEAAKQTARFSPLSPVSAAITSAFSTPACSMIAGSVASPWITVATHSSAMSETTRSSRSMIVTSWPRSASSSAVWKPTLPPPAMITSRVPVIVSRLPLGSFRCQFRRLAAAPFALGSTPRRPRRRAVSTRR